MCGCVRMCMCVAVSVSVCVLARLTAWTARHALITVIATSWRCQRALRERPESQTRRQQQQQQRQRLRRSQLHVPHGVPERGKCGSRNWAWLACLGHLRFGISARCSCWPRQAAPFPSPSSSSSSYCLLPCYTFVVLRLLAQITHLWQTTSWPCAVPEICLAIFHTVVQVQSLLLALPLSQRASQRGPEIGLGKLCGQAKHDGRLTAPRDAGRSGCVFAPTQKLCVIERIRRRRISRNGRQSFISKGGKSCNFVPISMEYRNKL